MKIGDYVHIGANTIVEAATIGNHVEIGKNCVIVNTLAYPFYLSLLTFAFKDCAKIADNSIIPPNTVIPALTLFTDSPGTRHRITKKMPTSYSLDIGHFVEDLPESTQEVVEAHTKSYYARFQPAER